MAGHAAPRELTHRHYEIARPEHDAAIRSLLRETPMEGGIRMTFEREPDYFSGKGLAGGEDQTIVAFAEEEVACVGRCVQRMSWVNGEPVRTGYMGELRLANVARGRFHLIRDGYQFFHEAQQARPAKLYFTSIAASNDRARRFLERGARWMPAYTFLAEYETMVLPTKCRPPEYAVPLNSVTAASIPEVTRFLNEHGRRHQLATVWTEDAIANLAWEGNRLFVAYRDKGRIAAVAGIWDQRPFRQMVIRGYPARLALLRPIVNLLAGFAGEPRFPRVGSALSMGMLTPLAWKPDWKYLAIWLQNLRCEAARLGMELLSLGIPADCPEFVHLSGPRAISYRTRLYRVDFPGDPRLELNDNPSFRPDLALL